MPQQLLDQLDELKTRFGAGGIKKLEMILDRLRRRTITDADELIRYHEVLLFLRAYPHNATMLRQVERELRNFAARVEALRKRDADLSPLDSPEVSGIAGTAVSDTFSYYIVRWLAQTQSRRLEFDWDWFDDEYRLAESWPRFMPLLEEDAFVEANVPYNEWLSAAASGFPGPRAGREVAWLIERFNALAKSDKEKAELFNSQKLYVRWTPEYRLTRTGMRLTTPAMLPARNVFYHREPLIQRRAVSLRRELETPPPPLKRLSTQQGAAILDLTRAASTVRYRELYGFTHGDDARVLRADLGRGVVVFVIGVPPGKRLPLRAYHAAMIFKNGVAVGYFEGISIFERMESGFNLYYTFRDGETAWLYARVLSIFHHLLGVTAFSIDPYQIGYENAEGIESGAFWFYRKLGFRPTKPEIMKLVLNEEKKIASRSNYRTSPRTLRRHAEGTMIFELDDQPRRSAQGSRGSFGRSKSGDWDQFQVRNIGLVVARRMGLNFNGDAERFRAAATKELARLLSIRTKDWRAAEQSALSDFAVALSLVEDLGEWSQSEKQALVPIIRAKAGADESRYLKLMQQHARLRAAVIKLGSP